MGWIHVRGHWLNLGALLVIRPLADAARQTVAVQVAFPVVDPLGPRLENDGTGLVTALYFGEDATRILRKLRL